MCLVRIEFCAILVPSIALSAMFPRAIVLAAISAVVILAAIILLALTELAANLPKVTFRSTIASVSTASSANWSAVT